MNVDESHPHSCIQQECLWQADASQACIKYLCWFRDVSLRTHPFPNLTSLKFSDWLALGRDWHRTCVNLHAEEPIPSQSLWVSQLAGWLWEGFGIELRWTFMQKEKIWQLLMYAWRCFDSCLQVWLIQQQPINCIIIKGPQQKEAMSWCIELMIDEHCNPSLMSAQMVHHERISYSQQMCWWIKLMTIIFIMLSSTQKAGRSKVLLHPALWVEWASPSCGSLLSSPRSANVQNRLWNDMAFLITQ